MQESYKSKIVIAVQNVLGLFWIWMFKLPKNGPVIKKNNSQVFIINTAQNMTQDMYVKGFEGKKKRLIHSEIMSKSAICRLDLRHPKTRIRSNWHGFSQQLPDGMHYV